MHPTPGTRRPGHLRVIRCVDGLQVNRKHVLDHQVREVLADRRVIVVHPDALLPHNREANRTYFICQRIPMGLFHVSGAKCIKHGVRAADHTFRKIGTALSACIGVNLLASAFKTLLCDAADKRGTEMLTRPRCTGCARRSQLWNQAKSKQSDPLCGDT